MARKSKKIWEGTMMPLSFAFFLAAGVWRAAAWASSHDDRISNLETDRSDDSRQIRRIARAIVAIEIKLGINPEKDDDDSNDR